MSGSSASSSVNAPSSGSSALVLASSSVAIGSSSAVASYSPTSQTRPATTNSAPATMQTSQTQPDPVTQVVVVTPLPTGQRTETTAAGPQTTTLPAGATGVEVITLTAYLTSDGSTFVNTAVALETVVIPVYPSSPSGSASAGIEVVTVFVDPNNGETGAITTDVVSERTSTDGAGIVVVEVRPSGPARSVDRMGYLTDLLFSCRPSQRQSSSRGSPARQIHHYRPARARLDRSCRRSPRASSLSSARRCSPCAVLSIHSDLRPSLQSVCAARPPLMRTRLTGLPARIILLSKTSVPFPDQL